ncbi:MAG: hypothetical protein Q8R26_01405 [bacterium]|nr:hypothetical protein [bacterium]
MNIKKYFKIIVWVLVAVGIGYGLYSFFKPKTASVTQPTIDNTQQIIDNEQIPINDSLVRVLTTEPIAYYWANAVNSSIYYLTKEGQVRKIGDITSPAPETVNSQTLNRLNSVAASYDGTYVVAGFNYPRLTTFSIFNTATNNWQPLPAGTVAAAWAPDKNELAYVGNGSLALLNMATQKSQTVTPLNQRDIVLHWPKSRTVFFVQRPTIDLAATLWSIDLGSKKITPVIQNEEGLMVQWYPHADIGVKLATVKRFPVTSFIHTDGSFLGNLQFVTLPSKCFVDAESAYCAVPESMTSGIKLPDDYLKQSVFFKDILYRINLGGGATTLLTANELLFDAIDISKYNNLLLFKNRYDDQLYSLNLQ